MYRNKNLKICCLRKQIATEYKVKVILSKRAKRGIQKIKDLYGNENSRILMRNILYKIFLFTQNIYSLDILYIYVKHRKKGFYIKKK